MFQLVVSMHVTSHNFHFGEDAAAAHATLDALQARLNEERFSKNRTEIPTFRFETPSGENVVVLDKIEAVRVIDLTKEDETVSVVQNERDSKEIERRIKYRRALKEASPEEPKPTKP